MDIIPSLLRDYGWAIYIAAALGCVYFIIVALTSMRDLNKAVFGLERSSVGARAGSAWVRAALCIVIGIGVYIASNMMGAAPTRVRITSIINATATVPAGVVLVPTSGPTADFLAPVITPTFIIQSAKPQAASAEATPDPVTSTANLLTEISAVTPDANTTNKTTSTPVPGLPTAAPIVTVSGNTSNTPSAPNAATSIAGTASARSLAVSPTVRAINITATITAVAAQPTPRPTLPPTDTPVPAPPTAVPLQVPAADCSDPLTVGIVAPQNGETVSGQLAIIGNAGIDPDGGYAKLEVLLPNGWGFINKIDNPIKGGALGSINTAALGQGVHRIRLLRVDKNQREDLLCAISILVAS